MRRPLVKYDLQLLLLNEENFILFLSVVFGRYTFILVIKMSPIFVNRIREKVCDNL
jgi:hypothetical protein